MILFPEINAVNLNDPMLEGGVKRHSLLNNSWQEAANAHGLTICFFIRKSQTPFRGLLQILIKPNLAIRKFTVMI